MPEAVMNISFDNTSAPANTTDQYDFTYPLWYKFDFCKDAPYAFLFYFVVKVINFVVGVPGNVMVVWHITKKKEDSSTSDVFILNLAILDTFFGLVTPIELFNRLIFNNSYVWYFQWFSYGVKDVTPLFLTCICLDRYVAVVHPIFFTGIRDNKIRIAVSVLVWALTLAYSLVKAIGGNDSVRDIFSGLILTAFSIMVFCNISIIWILRKSVVGKEEMHPVKKKAFKMVVIILAIIVVNYLPPVALFPFATYYSVVTFKCHVVIGVFTVMDLSCSIEPLLYMSKFEHLSCCLPCRNPTKSSSTVNA